MSSNSAIGTIETAAAQIAALSTADIIAKFGRGAADTGSPEVQVALITQRIEQIAAHTKKNAKDYHSLRGLLSLVSQRKRLLTYLKNESVERYKTLIAALGLRK